MSLVRRREASREGGILVNLLLIGTSGYELKHFGEVYRILSPDLESASHENEQCAGVFSGLDIGSAD